MKRWEEKEINYLKKNYFNMLDRLLSKKLGRSLKAVSYMAHKLGLKKDKKFFSESRRKLSIKFTKELVSNLYILEKKSTRKIAKELKVGKTTIEYYLKKFNVKRRNHSESNKIRFLEEDVWTKGLTKDTDSRIKEMAKKVSLTYKKKRDKKIKDLEKKYKKSLKDIIFDLYWKEELNQIQISKLLDFDKAWVVFFMKELKIKKRPNYQYISSLKGKKHPLYGITWEALLGKEEANKRKKESSKRFKELTLRRLEKSEFPFFDTKIEKLMAKELLRRKISFVKQFRIANKFVCDFAIPFLKIVIECDGDYWHSNPFLYEGKELTFTQNKIKKRDVNKNKELTKKGWVVLRFFEADIKSNIKKCGDKIEQAIGKKLNELKKIKSPLDTLNE